MQVEPMMGGLMERHWALLLVRLSDGPLATPMASTSGVLMELGWAPQMAVPFE
jgi:hypothetical protein